MSEIIKEIINTKKSNSYIKYNNYHKNNIFGITKVSRWELMHSNFIGWLLSDDSGLGENHFQTYRFILMLYCIKDRITSEKAKIDEKVIEKFLQDDFIKAVSVYREKDNIDILINVTTKDKILPIIIENKVDSKENGKNKDQTINYYEYAKNEYGVRDNDQYYKPICIFLVPAYNKTNPKEEAFIQVSYQELVDYVIEPTMNNCKNKELQENIRNYLQCLSFQSDNEKGDKIMAISSEEKKIINDFIVENKNLISIVIESLEDVAPETKDNLKDIIRGYSHDNTKYNFNGNSNLPKRQLVLAVVKQYINENSNCDFNNLKSKFPDELQGSFGVICCKNEVRDTSRYFMEDAITLQNGDKVVVCNQWGIDNIKNFIDHVRNDLNYTIEESVEES